MSKSPRKGLALILVLIVITMLSLSAYTFTSLMMAENESAVLHGQQLQARAAVDSGVSQISYFFEQEALVREDLGGTYINPDLFQAQLVIDHPQPRGRARFAVLAPEMSDDGYFGGMRFGLEDESGRLNLNSLNMEIPDIVGDPDEVTDVTSGSVVGDLGSLIGQGGGSGSGSGSGSSGEDEDAEEEDIEVDKSGRTMLMQLPGMTVDTADAILDWLDEDDDPRQYGAEYDYYGGLAEPYAPKNGPLESLEELLLVRGVTPELLFGRDTNRNGIIDLHEQEIIIPEDLGDGTLDRGWSAYLTLYSAEKNMTRDGLARIDLNGDDLEILYEELSTVLDPGWATFIVAYRQFGPYNSPEDQEGGGRSSSSAERVPPGDQPLDFTRSGRVPLTQVLDLVGVDVRAQLDGGEDPVILECPFPNEPLLMGSYMPSLMEYCTVVPDPIIPGRININRAPYTVLMTIPGMTTEMADSIINGRDVADIEFDEEFQNETWLLSRAILTLEEMREMMPYMTARGDVFRSQIVGYFDEGEIAARSEVIFDATSTAPRILFWRDISHLGRGYPTELLGVDLTDSTED